MIGFVGVMHPFSRWPPNIFFAAQELLDLNYMFHQTGHDNAIVPFCNHSRQTHAQTMPLALPCGRSHLTLPFAGGHVGPVGTRAPLILPCNPLPFVLYFRRPVRRSMVTHTALRHILVRIALRAYACTESVALVGRYGWLYRRCSIRRSSNLPFAARTVRQMCELCRSHTVRRPDVCCS